MEHVEMEVITLLPLVYLEKIPSRGHIAGYNFIEWSVQVKRNRSHYRVLELVDREGNISQRIFLMSLTVIIPLALIYLVKILSAGHIQVKLGFQVKRNCNHYRFPEKYLCCETDLSRQAAIKRKKENENRQREKLGFLVKRNRNHYSDYNSSQDTSGDESRCKGYPSEVDVQVEDNHEHCRFPEKCLCCETDLSRQAAIKRKKEKNNRQTRKKNEEPPHIIMLMNACALLNSGGGVLRIKISGRDNHFWKQLENISQPFEEKLTNMVKPLTYNDVCYRRVVGLKEIQLFFKAPQHFCTLFSNLYFACDIGTYEASSEQVVNMLQNLGKKFSNDVDVPLKDLSNLPEEFTYKEKLGYHESRQTQFKCYKQEDPILKSKSQQDRVQRHISAFGNTIGGQILLGVTDDGEVFGVDMKKNSQSMIEEKVNSLIKDMIFPVTPRRSVHWDIEFIPVSGDTTTTQERALVVIKVAGMKNRGGVFIKCPKSYEWLDRDTIQEIEFDQWKQRMLSDRNLNRYQRFE